MGDHQRQAALFDVFFQERTQQFGPCGVEIGERFI